MTVLSARGRSIALHAVIAAAAYLPILSSSPGRVSADTKTYLHLDPGRVMERALSMWDPNVGLGTVTHQTIGYLFPMGPYYWLLDWLGTPDWFAQRLWLASILFAAGAGVLFLARTLGWAGAGPAVAAFAYMLSPYTLHYSARISVILLPWAALPWTIALVERALRRGGWRHPAAFALVVTTVGGVNATALVLAGLGPLLWVPFSVARTHIPWRHGLAVVGRIGVLGIAASLWWLAGLWVQGTYGIEILRYTETVETVSRTSLASEILRGLGYWFFYGNDKLGPWIEPGIAYTQNVGLILVGFAMPAGALLAAGFLRWSYRAYFVTLVLAGMVIAVGAHPYDDPSPVGSLWKAFASSSTVGLALRSTPRAVPLVVLGLAVLLGAGISALSRRVPRVGVALACVATAVIAAGIPPLWTGDLPVGDQLDRPEQIPGYWKEAAGYLDSRAAGTRVLEVPGSDFAAYRWGNTVDPITPYLMDRPYVARELIPYGSPAGADLLNALDRRLQEGVFEPRTLAPVAALMGAGDVVVRSDLEYERYRTPRPRSLWYALSGPAAGLAEPVSFGSPAPNRAGPEFPLIDEVELGVPPDASHPPPVAAFAVRDPLPIIRTHPTSSPLVLAGDGEGIVDAAGAGLLDPDRAVLYEAALDDDDLTAAIERGATVVVTDTNRKRARRWGTVRENAGYTEPAGRHEPLRADPGDNRLPVFPDAGDASATVVEWRGVRNVAATAYGNPVSYTAEDRPAHAIDGDLDTAWRVGAFADVRGERIRVELDEPVTTSAVRVVQPLTGPRNRFMTEIEVRLDDGDPVAVRLDDSSRTPAGQLVTFDVATFTTVELEVKATNIGPRARYDGVSGVGVAELVVDGVSAQEVVRLPTRALDQLGASHNPLHIVLTRLRANPAEPVRDDEEPSLRRSFDLADERRFLLSGRARIADEASDDLVDALVGVGPGRARSSGRLPGALHARASSAADGDASTAWTPRLGPQEGNWVEVDFPAARTLDGLDLRVVADGRHSIPTRLVLTGDGGQSRTVGLPAIDAAATAGATVTVPVTFPALHTRSLRLTVEAVAEVTVRDYYSEGPIGLPVGIAEIGPRLFEPGSEAAVDTGCRKGLVEIDGQAVAVRLHGYATDPNGLVVEGCDEAVELSAGAHEVATAKGSSWGINMDRLVFSSAGALPPGAIASPPGVDVVVAGHTEYRLSIPSSTEPFWLVLAQSHNAGWQAAVEGRRLDGPRLVDGFANGWLIEPSASTREIVLEWAPQRWVWLGLGLSLLANLVCLAIVVLSRRDRAEPQTTTAELGVSSRGGRRLGAVAVVAAFGLAVATPPVALAGAGAIALLAWTARIGSLVRALPAVLVLLIGAYTAAQQWRYDYPAGFEWPTYFSRLHPIAWMAIAVLLGIVLVDYVARHASGGRRG